MSRELMDSVRSQEQTPISPCASPPSYLARTHFQVQHLGFQEVANRVSSTLLNCRVDFFHDVTDNCFICKQVTPRGNVREDYINCYWDMDKGEHILEVRRMRGGGFLMIPDDEIVDILEKLRVSFGATNPMSDASRWQSVFSLPSTASVEVDLDLDDEEEQNENGESGSNRQQFLDMISSFARESPLSSRKEAARILCDFFHEQEQQTSLDQHSLEFDTQQHTQLVDIFRELLLPIRSTRWLCEEPLSEHKTNFDRSGCDCNDLSWRTPLFTLTTLTEDKELALFALTKYLRKYGSRYQRQPGDEFFFLHPDFHRHVESLQTEILREGTERQRRCDFAALSRNISDFLDLLGNGFDRANYTNQ